MVLKREGLNSLLEDVDLIQKPGFLLKTINNELEYGHPDYNPSIRTQGTGKKNQGKRPAWIIQEAHFKTGKLSSAIGPTMHISCALTSRQLS